MATKTITIKESAYRALLKCRRPEESFSDTIEREIGEKVESGADLLALVRRRGGLGLSKRRGRKSHVA
jgi:predicted CopG family antitoxin